MTRSKTLRRLCKPKCTSEQANGSFHVRFLSIFGGTLSGKKNQIIGFTTLLSCLAFDLKRFVAFCFFNLIFLTILRYVEAVDTIGDLTRSIQGRAAEPKEELDAPWRSQKMDRRCQGAADLKHFSTPRKVWILGEFQILNTKKRGLGPRQRFLEVFRSKSRMLANLATFYLIIDLLPAFQF